MSRRPSTPGEGTLAVDGAQLRFRLAGRGPLLVMQAPGWGIGADVYAATLSRLEDRFTVVYVWPRGAAGSRPDAHAVLDIPAFVTDLEALRVELGADRFLLAGHSHGGLIALHYALQHAERVRGLLLLSPQLLGVTWESDAHSDPLQDPPEVMAAMQHLASVGGFEAFFRATSDEEATALFLRILPLYFVDPAHVPVLEAALAGVVLPRRTMLEVGRSDAGHPLDPAALARLSIPSLVVSGRHDRFCAAAGARHLAGLLPAARLLELPASGHFPWVEEPDAFYAGVTAGFASAD